MTTVKGAAIGCVTTAAIAIIAVVVINTMLTAHGPIQAIAMVLFAIPVVLLAPRVIASMWTRGRSEDWRRERRR